MPVRHAILALLSEGPKFGLQLRNEFESRTGEVWALNVGQVYQTLQRLERDGLVEAAEAGDGAQRRYAITATGEVELQSWLRTPPDLSLPPRDELVVKVLVAMQMPKVAIDDVIQTHRKYLIELMQQWTRLKDSDDDDLAFLLLVDAELLRIDGLIRWLDTAEGRIHRAATEPPRDVPPRRVVRLRPVEAAR